MGEHAKPTASSSIRRLAKALAPPIARRWFRGLRRMLYKGQLIRHYRLLQRAPVQAVRYLVRGREIDNFTYEIANEDELAQFLEDAIGVSETDAARYMAELQDDSELRAAIEAKLRGRSDRNPAMPYGRRLGWYAIVRARKPKLVAETGVHDGLGSAVLLRALQRNAKEGSEGTLVSFDVNDQVGWLIPDFVMSRYQLEIGPAPDVFGHALRGRPVDFFIHDSDHRYEHETAEFDAIWPLTSSNAVLLTDNAHAGTAFRDFCSRQGLIFHFFAEIPRGHWYPGAGIGLAIRGKVAELINRPPGQSAAIAAD
jgi:hypothetical protein